MAHTTTSMEIFGSPEQVWQLIGGFNPSRLVTLYT